MGEMHGSLEKNSCLQKKNCELKERAINTIQSDRKETKK